MGFFTATEVDPKTSPFLDDALRQAVVGWFRGMFTPTADGGFAASGAQMFNPYLQDAINAREMRIPVNQNLQNTWGNYQAGSQGNNFLAQMLRRSGPDPGIAGRLNTVADQGTMGGDPGAMLMAMARGGGAGQRGMPAMSAALQFGAPSQVGQFVANQAQFGVGSEAAGRPLANRAYGQQTAAQAFLQPFLQRGAQGYRAPQIQRRTPTQQGAI